MFRYYKYKEFEEPYQRKDGTWVCGRYYGISRSRMVSEIGESATYNLESGAKDNYYYFGGTLGNAYFTDYYVSYKYV